MSMENCANTKPKITIIPAKTRVERLDPMSIAMGQKPKIRVAAYARVSTDHEEQESSYEAQVDHFTKLIASHDDWTMVDIYADPGLSGKNTKRVQFKRMIKDCEDGKIDLIITKSVSRFARNTLDCVQTARKLKADGIGIIFEKENLDTLQERSEFVLTIMASLAEEESRSISNNIRWSVKKKFQEGKVILNTKHFLGYTRDKKGTVLKIVPEEAITVRRIYAEFLDGKSLKEIAEGLERDGIASPSGRETWHPSTVKSILQNEKYKGDCHLQKTYLPDFLSPRRIKNEGFAQSWYVEDSHAAIISKETFDMVQQEFQNRQSLRSTGETGCGKFSGKYPFSGMIVCGECGETYRRHQQYNKYKKYYIWVCKRHENNGAEYCKSRPIKEEALEKAFVRALNELIGDKEQILEKLQSATVSEITDSCATAINEVNAEIEKLQEQMMELLMKRNNGEITDKEYEQQSQQVGMKIDQLLMRKEEILSEQGKVQLASYRIEEVTKLLQTGKILEEFDRVMFKSLVRKITVLSNKEIEIEFECGITVRETL